MNPVEYEHTTYTLEREGNTSRKVLRVDGDTTGFEGKERDGVYVCPLTAQNAAVLRKRLPWLNPQPLGLATSFGFGDRLGMATPGHISAVSGTGIAPVFAQQSVRENARTGRTPQIVLDDAMWAVFEADWREPWGADADHVKEIADLPPFIEAGYSFYTIDPNDYVDNDAYTDSPETLREKVRKLPWDALKITWQEWMKLYGEAPFLTSDFAVQFDEEILLRAAAKYGRAIAHIKEISDYLVGKVTRFDLEASVDETDTPTSPAEHCFIANELRRLDVPFVSLAPRFIGSFEKGVDYIGDLDEFDRELERHVAVMHAIGGYKLSIHTGSDKFSIYASIAHQTHNLVHVKTAGTSYLEALRVIAATDPVFFREILDFARSRYEHDKVTYHVSAHLENVPHADGLSDEQLSEMFTRFDARQVLHVTFGSVLDVYGAKLKETLAEHLDLYDTYLQAHFRRHLAPFVESMEAAS